MEERQPKTANVLPETGRGPHRYMLTGTVVHGKALGRTVGMPTANLAVEAGTSLPPAGVYASIMTLPEGRFMGLTNIGTRPTVDRENRTTVETYLFDFDRNIYGEEAGLELCFFIRGIRKFGSLEEVWDQVRRDEAAARERLREIYHDETPARR